MIKDKRIRLGLSQRDFATLIGLKEHGERTIRGWENDEHSPSDAKISYISKIKTSVPFMHTEQVPKFTFCDLFAGIGGIRLAFQQLGGKAVFSSEWDKFAQRTYAANFGQIPAGDITKIKARDIPDHDILLAGFPCQSFSQAGLKKGFLDTRGTMFFEIQKILAAKKPKMFLLENVKQLKGHDKGRTLNTMLDILTGQSGGIDETINITEEATAALGEKLNYWVDYRILKSSDFGIPQKRARIILVGFNKDHYEDPRLLDEFSWPSPYGIPTCVGQILEPSEMVDDKYTISKALLDGHIRRLKGHKNRGNGFGYSSFKASDPATNTISARYYKDGSEALIEQTHLNKRPRKLTPRECARLQGFPEEFVVDAVSDAQAYRQFGNSVTVTVIKAVAEKMLELDRWLTK